MWHWRVCVRGQGKGNNLSLHKGWGIEDIFPYCLPVLPSSESEPESSLSTYVWGVKVSKP